MVLSDDELRALAEVAVEADLLVISDEVYERLTFGAQHRPVATYPAWPIARSRSPVRPRCSIAPAGRSAGRAARSWSPACGRPSSTCPTSAGPFQPAVAYALDNEDAWVDGLRTHCSPRDKLAAALTNIGSEVHDSSGTYFLCADPRPLGFDDSAEFCERLPIQTGVAAIPMTAFCDPGRAPDA